MIDTKRPLRVFLCHASGDKPAVKELYERLVKDGVDAWLDKEKLIPGQDWQIEIPKAVKNSDVVIVCLSSQSITKEGFVQKEIKYALDAADEKPDGTIFIIPARLEICEVPERISRFQWVDLYSSDGYEWLLKALQLRVNNLGIAIKRKKNTIMALDDIPSIVNSSKDSSDKTSGYRPSIVTNEIDINKTHEQPLASFENSKKGQENYSGKKYGHFLLKPRFKIGIILGLIGSILPYGLSLLFSGGGSAPPIFFIVVGSIAGSLSGYLTDRIEIIKHQKEGGIAGLVASLATGVGHYLGFPLMSPLYYGYWSPKLIFAIYGGASLGATFIFLLPSVIMGYIFGYYCIRHANK